jgi:hypothetical protein
MTVSRLPIDPQQPGQIPPGGYPPSPAGPSPSGTSAGAKSSPSSVPATHPAAAAGIGSYFDLKDSGGDTYRLTFQVPSSVKASKVQRTDSGFGSTVRWNVP